MLAKTSSVLMNCPGARHFGVAPKCRATFRRKRMHSSINRSVFNGLSPPNELKDLVAGLPILARTAGCARIQTRSILSLLNGGKGMLRSHMRPAKTEDFGQLAYGGRARTQRFGSLEKQVQTSAADETKNRDLTTNPFGNLGADDELVIAAKNGDECALELLIKRHRSRIFAVALRYTRIHEDAEDIVQQTFQKAFVYLHKFQGKSSFSTWLTRIAINECLMFLRKGRTIREISLDQNHREEKTSDSSLDPEVRYLQLETARMLSSAMAKLRPCMRLAVELRELKELSGPETARKMGVSVRAVKARVFHGRRKLREMLRRSARSARRPGGTIIAMPRNVASSRKVT
jgi:RNA polymerase sigma-70 factor, ECF subfamily